LHKGIEPQMLKHMRTTVDIGDHLLKEVHQVIAKRRTTLRALVEEGLRRVLAEEREAESCKLRDARFKGPAGFAQGVSAEDLPRLFTEMRNENRFLP